MTRRNHGKINNSYLNVPILNNVQIICIKQIFSLIFAYKSSFCSGIFHLVEALPEYSCSKLSIIYHWSTFDWHYFMSDITSHSRIVIFHIIWSGHCNFYIKMLSCLFEILMIKIGQHHDRLVFIIGYPIHDKIVLIFNQTPRGWRQNRPVPNHHRFDNTEVRCSID